MKKERKKNQRSKSKLNRITSKKERKDRLKGKEIIASDGRKERITRREARKTTATSKARQTTS